MATETAMMTATTKTMKTKATEVAAGAWKQRRGGSGGGGSVAAPSGSLTAAAWRKRGVGSATAREAAWQQRGGGGSTAAAPWQRSGVGQLGPGGSVAAGAILALLVAARQAWQRQWQLGDSNSSLVAAAAPWQRSGGGQLGPGGSTAAAASLALAAARQAWWR